MTTPAATHHDGGSTRAEGRLLAERRAGRERRPTRRGSTRDERRRSRRPSPAAPPAAACAATSGSRARCAARRSRSPTNNSAVAIATTSSTANPRSRIPPRNAAAYRSPIERRSVTSIAAKSAVWNATAQPSTRSPTRRSTARGRRGSAEPPRERDRQDRESNHHRLDQDRPERAALVPETDGRVLVGVGERVGDPVTDQRAGEGDPDQRQATPRLTSLPRDRPLRSTTVGT